MNNNDYVWWFAILGLFNTNIGISNFDKNKEQADRQVRIEQKLDKILEILSNE